MKWSNRIIEVMAHIDLWGLRQTRKISVALNWTFGKAPREFFPIIWMTSPIAYADDMLRGTSTGGIVVSQIFTLFIIGSEYLFKWHIETNWSAILDYIFNRAWWIIITIITTILPPFSLITLAFFIVVYCQYCYLHDLPPRDSVFARAGKKIKEKLQSFSLAPSPSPA